MIFCPWLFCFVPSLQFTDLTHPIWRFLVNIYFLVCREAVVSTPNEDEYDLTEDDLKAIAKEQMNSQVL